MENISQEINEAITNLKQEVRENQQMQSNSVSRLLSEVKSIHHQNMEFQKKSLDHENPQMKQLVNEIQ